MAVLQHGLQKRLLRAGRRADSFRGRATKWRHPIRHVNSRSENFNRIWLATDVGAADLARSRAWSQDLSGKHAIPVEDLRVHGHRNVYDE